jgi:hypothetical protein
MLIVVIAIGVVASVRGLTEGWLWIPILALAMWYAVYRWLGYEPRPTSDTHS